MSFAMRYSRKNITPGTIIHSEEPFVYCLSSKIRNEYCDFCFKKGMLLKCAACQYVYYCNKTCQKDAWPMHKTECKDLKKVAPRIIPDAARMMARLIRTLNKNGRSRHRYYYTDVDFRMYTDLMSHYPELKNDTKRMEHFQSLCGVLYEFMNEKIIPNTVDLMKIFGAMCINSFNICSEEQQTLGTGMYVAASIIDHSCEPNALAMFEGKKLHIRALVPMTYLNWNEIHISYIDVLNSRRNRVEELERIYYFTCNCPRCSIPDPEELDAAACPNENCNNSINLNVLTMEKCSRCEEKICSAYREKFAEVNELTDKYLQNTKELADLDTAKVNLEIQKGVLHKLNIKHVKTLDLTFESCINSGKFEDALHVGLQLIKPFHKYYGKFHPLTGLLHLKLGKIFMHLDDTTNDLKQLKNAYDILKVTHGLQSDIFREELMPILMNRS